MAKIIDLSDSSKAYLLTNHDFQKFWVIFAALILTVIILCIVALVYATDDSDDNKIEVDDDQIEALIQKKINMGIALKSEIADNYVNVSDFNDAINGLQDQINDNKSDIQDLDLDKASNDDLNNLSNNIAATYVPNTAITAYALETDLLALQDNLESLQNELESNYVLSSSLSDGSLDMNVDSLTAVSINTDDLNTSSSDTSSSDTSSTDATSSGT